MAASITSTPGKMDIYSKMMAIFEKYVSIDDNTDILNAGALGAMTEAQAMMIRDSAFHKTMLYNESFLNTAIMPSSVYNWAKMFDLDVNVATPAYAEINIMIPLDKLKASSYESASSTYDYSTEVSSSIENIQLVIDKENQIIAGDYYFALEHSIIIISPGNGSGKTYLAKYSLNETATTDYETISRSAYLPVSYDGTNVIIKARAYQYRIASIKRQLSSSTMRNKVQTFSFEDQFAGAKLYYREFGTSAEEEIELRYSNVGATVSGSAKYAFYDLSSDNELEISFKAGSGGFVPAPNAVLTAKIFSTKGSNIPTKYSGDAYFRTNDENLKNLNAVIQFDPTDLIGGKDAPTVDELKQTIIRNLSMCDTIVTESDLNNYFGILTSLLDTINDGEVTFVKRRDDIMRRIFTAYILLRDGLTDDGNEVTGDSAGFISRCIPTNTVTATFPAAMLSGQNTLIYPRIILNSSTGKYRGMLANEADDDYYFSPFYIYVSLSPIKRVKYIYNLADDQSPASCTGITGSLYGTYTDDEGTEVALYANPITMSVYRGLGSEGSAESAYTFEMTMTSNMTAAQFQAKVKTITIQYYNDSTSRTDLKEFKVGDTVATYDAVEEESSSGDGSYTLTLSMTVDADSQEFDFMADSDSYGETIRLNDRDGNPVNVMESNTFVMVFSDTNDAASITYETDNELRLFRSLDEVMYSDLAVNSAPVTGATLNDDSDSILTEITSITISDIPVIHSSYFENAQLEDDFIEQMFTYIDILEENIGKLETNTFFDLKFYNTHGLSKMFNTTTTNIDLEMTIHLNDSVNTYTADMRSSLESEIRSYVRRLIDKMNDDGTIKVSKVIGQLSRDETYGEYINYIDFTGLNGTFAQAITPVDATAAYKTQYPPEWINIDRTCADHIEFVID